jgi:hypothetical protein
MGNVLKGENIYKSHQKILAQNYFHFLKSDWETLVLTMYIKYNNIHVKSTVIKA